MSKQAIYEIPAETAQKPAVAPRPRKHNGFTRLMGISGFAMSLLLPIGIVPRLMQGHELEQTYEKTTHALPKVSIVQSKLAGANRQINLPGSIEAILETPVYARTNGYIKERLVDIGDKVTAGQILATIQTPEVDQGEVEAKAQVLSTIAQKAQSEANRERAQADIDTAEAALSQMRANLSEHESEQKFALATYLRFKKLGEQGAVSIQDVEEKETRSKTTAAEVEATKDRIKAAQSEVLAAKAKFRAEQANVRVSDATINAARAHEQQSTIEKSFQNVVSPFAGVITERNIDQGVLVSSGSDNSKVPIYRVARIDTVKVFVDVPQYASSGIHVGQQVAVSLKEFPGKQFLGQVARTSVALDPVARTLRTEVHIANSELTLAPGMYADVSFSIPRPSQLFLIPANTLVNRSAGPQVLVVTPNHKVHYNQVKLGEDLGSEIEVTTGLTGKESLIVNPSDALKEGTQVSINQ